MEQRYRTYSSYLKQKYGHKVYKLPVNLPVTCPNRDGKVGVEGCAFCGEEGAGFDSLPSFLSVEEQLRRNKEYIGTRYHVKKFIAYFQAFTSTYMPLAKFQRTVESACIEDVVGIAVSTRPDCINSHYLEALAKVSNEKGVDIYLEFGLQTVNYHTLKKINRGHSLAEFIDAVLQTRKFGFDVCAHLILNLPGDDMDDVIENAKILSALRVNQVKLHALYILEGTRFGEMYRRGEIEMISLDEYKERVITFLEYLNPEIAVQRLVGRPPKENTLFANWGTSWWKIRDDIIKMMEERNTYQGRKFCYLSGKALRGIG